MPDSNRSRLFRQIAFIVTFLAIVVVYAVAVLG
mgnify:CR=1 FL=1